MRLDGVSIGNWNKRELCDYIGYLPQEIQLFGGEIIKNITRYKEPDKKNLKKFVKILTFITFTRLLLNRRPLLLSDDLFDVPGGLKQRIALARAFYNLPNYIILDEPTSSLDAQFENKLLTILQNIKSAEH